MATVLVNGLQAKVGGGRSILNNYLKLLQRDQSPHRYLILTPDAKEYEKYANERIELLELSRVYRTKAGVLPLYHSAIPSLLRRYRVNLILNLGDIVIPSSLPQVYNFDWPYAVYPESIVWNRLDFPSYVERKAKLFLFKRYLRNATIVIAQSGTMKRRLEQLHGLSNIQIVPNAVSLENLSGGRARDFHLPKAKRKLLYLTHYYSHKNLEVLLPLAHRIKARGLPYCLVTTVSATQHRQARAFLDAVRQQGLDTEIINIGPVPMEEVPSLYAQSDALLMPTLLESFSGTYVEAMFHKIVILTSIDARISSGLVGSK